MIDDSECREIAARLAREAQVWRETFPYYEIKPGDALEIMQDIFEFVGLRGKVLCCDMFQRFADLIDRPTCKNVGGEEHAFMCSECGAYTTEFSHFFAPKEEQERLKSELCEVMGLDREETRFLSIHSSVPKHCPWCGKEMSE